MEDSKKINIYLMVDCETHMESTPLASKIINSHLSKFMKKPFDKELDSIKRRYLADSRLSKQFIRHNYDLSIPTLNNDS